MGLPIRRFKQDDYPAIVEIINTVYPEYPRTVKEIRFNDEHRDPRCKFERYVAEREGRVIGISVYDQFPDMYHPRRFYVNIIVHPDSQHQGVGSELYNHLVEELQQFDPLSFRHGIREDMTSGIRFLKHRGFKEDNRGWESRLDVAAFDFSPFEGLEEKVCDQGIEIKTMRQLEDDSERNRKLYELDCEVVKDEPSPEPYTPISYEYFIKRALNHPGSLPDAYFVAVHNDDYVGISCLWANQSNNDLHAGQTGVKRAYRRRGIATTLKLRTIAYAKEHKHPIIKTWNDSANRPMLSINERLGFMKQPAWIDFVKIIKEE